MEEEEEDEEEEEEEEEEEDDEGYNMRTRRRTPLGALWGHPGRLLGAS